MKRKVRKLFVGEKINKWISLSTTCMILLLLFFLLLKTTGFIFISNDDIFIQAILSGNLTGSPDAHVVYILYPLAWIISLLYRIVPTINWYGIFVLGIHFVCWGIILFRSTLLARTRWEQIRNFSFAFFVLLFVDLQWLIFSQYTALASVIACTALFCIITVENKEKLREYMLPIVLIVISFSLRSSAALMCIPFFLIYFIFQLVFYLYDKKDQDFAKKLIKLYSRIIAILALIFILLFGIHRLAYQADEWKYYDEYNQYRTDVYDYYLFPQYNGNETFYDSIGIEKEEMYVIESGNLGLSDEISAETMEAIYERSKEIKENSEQFSNIPRRLVFDYLDSFDQTNRELLLVYFLYGALLVLAIKKKQNSYLLGIISVFFARSGMRSYLIFMERLPERVSSPLAMIEIVTLLGILLNALMNEKKESVKTNSCKTGYIFGCAVLSMFILLLMADVYKENLDRSVMIKNENAWSENILPFIEEDEEHNYLLDVYSVASMKAPIFRKGGLPSNALILGGWLQESPLLEQQYINRCDCSSGKQAAFLESTRFIQKEGALNDALKVYLELDGKRVIMEEASKIDKDEESLFVIYEIREKK